MPKLPEVEALVGFLEEKLKGQEIDRFELVAFSALKTFDPPVDALSGRIVEAVTRRGKFLDIDLGALPDPLHLVFHLARGGWVKWSDALPAARAKPSKGPLAFRLRLVGGSGIDVTEMGTEKRLAAYVVRSPDEVEGVARLGPDPLAPGFDLATFRASLAGQPGNIKKVLTDQGVIAGVGNAYSDEALHAAHMSPFKPAGKLSDDESARLFEAVVAVLRDALQRSAGLPAKGLKAEKKEGLKVHGRAGQPCPVCGDTVREVSFATKSLQ